MNKPDIHTCPLCLHKAEGHGDEFWSCTNDPDCPVGFVVYSLETWTKIVEEMRDIVAWYNKCEHKDERIERILKHRGLL